MQLITALLIFQTAELPAPLRTLPPWLDARMRAKRQVFADLDQQTHRRFIKTHTVPAPGAGRRALHLRLGLQSPGLFTRPTKSRVPVPTLRTRNRNGWSKVTRAPGDTSTEVGTMLTPVAAAASVPFSPTLT